MFREHIENLQWKLCANSAEQYKTKVRGFIHDTFVEHWQIYRYLLFLCFMNDAQEIDNMFSLALFLLTAYGMTHVV